MLTLLQTLIGQQVDLFVGGHWFTGSIVTIDATNTVVTFTVNRSNFSFSINSIDGVKID
jgi:hypothetical protein